LIGLKRVTLKAFAIFNKYNSDAQLAHFAWALFPVLAIWIWGNRLWLAAFIGALIGATRQIAIVKAAFLHAQGDVEALSDQFAGLTAGGSVGLLTYYPRQKVKNNVEGP